MVDVLNEFDISAAVFGNHEFDYGIQSLQECLVEMNFPWICSNVTDDRTGKCVAQTRTKSGALTGIPKHVILQRTTTGKMVKIGLIGLAEPDWIESTWSQHMVYEDYVDKANELVAELKEEGVDIVIALTHMREKHDIRLAREVEGIDLGQGWKPGEYLELFVGFRLKSPGKPIYQKFSDQVDF